MIPLSRDGIAINEIARRTGHGRGIAEIYGREVERLVEALNTPSEGDEAAETIRGLIERVTLTPGPRRGVLDGTVHGEFGAILEWVGTHPAGPALSMRWETGL